MEVKSIRDCRNLLKNKFRRFMKLVNSQKSLTNWLMTMNIFRIRSKALLTIWNQYQLWDYCIFHSRVLKMNLSVRFFSKWIIFNFFRFASDRFNFSIKSLNFFMWTGTQRFLITELNPSTIWVFELHNCKLEMRIWKTDLGHYWFFL